MGILLLIRPYMALWGSYMGAFWFTMMVLSLIGIVVGAPGALDNAFSYVAGDLQTKQYEASGILELWLHEIIRAAPMLIPGAGAVWGFIVAFTGYPLFTILISPDVLLTNETGGLLFFVVQPLLAANVLAQIILMKHSITWARALWSMREMEDGRLEVIRGLAKPTVIAFGIAIACLFLSATITYIATEGQYSPAAMHMELIDNGAIEKMGELLYRGLSLVWTEPDWDNIEDALL